MKELNDILKRCQKNERKAQKQLYDHYSPLFMGMARRYVKKTHDAEDVVINAWCKIFEKLHQYSGNGSFEGWMKRIVINEALMFLRKNNTFDMSIESSHLQLSYEDTILDSLYVQDLIGTLDQLAVGYRTIFNLYVVEGYKHREIAEKLNISINTSKSQLIYAKKRLRSLLKKKGKIRTG